MLSTKHLIEIFFFAYFGNYVFFHVFQIWQCGGKLEIIPCSRVGHVFRSRFPYKFPGGYHEVTVNLARVVHVWMDDYKKFVFLKRPDLQGVEHGDLTKRLELRKRLKCKSFKWYMENIYPEQKTPSEDYEAYGEVSWGLEIRVRG